MVNIILESLQEVLRQIIGVLPNIIGALVLLLLGWILAKTVSAIIARILRRIGLDKLADKLNETDAFRESNITIRPVIIIQKFLYWTIFLIFILSATETLGLDILTQQVSKIIDFIPKLLTAMIIMGIGFYLADAIKRMVGNAAQAFGIPSWKVISYGVFYVLMIAISITALEQAGIMTDIIKWNIYIVLAGVFLAFAIAYGFAARNVLTSILTSYYSKSSFSVGLIIELEGYKGTIVKMDNVSFTLDLGTEYVVFPQSKLLNDKVIIHHPKTGPAIG
jgi:hypothetical protein